MELELIVQNMDKQKEQMSRELHDNENNFKDNLELWKNKLDRLEKNLRDKEEIIGMIGNNLKEMEMEA